MKQTNFSKFRLRILLNTIKTDKILANTFFQYFILLLLVYLVFFVKLGSFHMRWWDESVFAVNTYEMMQNAKYFSLYFNNAPDFFNFKPPLSFWAQLSFVKLFGYNELSLRLPSAMAAAMSVILMFKFISTNFNYLWAWISALILITSYGFVGFHTARTADSDALLTLFVLLANLSFMRYVLSHNKWHILWFFIWISFSFYTKSFASLFFAPAYFFILFQKKLLKSFIINIYFFIGCCVFLLAALSFFYLREQDTPGFINAFLYSDASRIYNTIWSEHKHEILFYVNNFFESRFAFWSILFIMGSVLLFFNKNEQQKLILFSFLTLVCGYLFVITISITKLAWYDMPLYPYLSVIAAYPFVILIKFIRIKEKPLSSSLKAVVLVLFFLYPYILIFNKSQANTIPNTEKHLEANEMFINKKIKSNQSLDGIKVYYSGWHGALLFYKYKFLEKGDNIFLVNNIDDIFKNDIVMVCNDSLKDLLRKRFDLIKIEGFLNSELYTIH